MKKLLWFYLIGMFNFGFGQSNNFSLFFDGSDDYVSAPNPLSSVTQLSLACWTKFDSAGTNGNLIGDWMGGNGKYLLRYDTYLGNHSIAINISGTTNSGMISFPLTHSDFGKWMFITFTYDGSNMKLYQNAVLKSSAASSLGNIVAGSQIITMGTEENYNFGQSHPQNPTLNGFLDEVSVWSVALSDAEILDAMNCSLLGNETGLLGFWNFEEGSGTTTNDQTANGNNGTLTNGPVWSMDVPASSCCTPAPITSQPTDQSLNVSDTAYFSFTDILTGASYKWQMDAGTGFQNLSNAGQFSGAFSQILQISNLTLANDNTFYRGIATESSSCKDTTIQAKLTVSETISRNPKMEESIQIYPIPSRDILKISTPQYFSGQVEILDLTGKSRGKFPIEGGKLALNGPLLGLSGILVLVIRDKSGKIITRKRVVFEGQ
ncbi:MAG: LamG domain-containing protein [Bacteroidia bacterium]|nr:LamG domain-containing protein [Bacteroidia bacterium]